MGFQLTQLASDNFQRSNISLLAAPWTVDEIGDAGFQIANDVAEPASNYETESFGFPVQLYDLPGGTPNDQYASLTLAAALSTKLHVGIRATDAGNHWGTDFPSYMLQVRQTTGNWTVFEWGAENTLANGTGLTVSPGDTFTIAAVGTTIYVFQNSTLLTSFTDTTYASGLTAMGAGNATATNPQYSNFAMGSAAGTYDTYDPTIPFLGSISESATDTGGPYIGHVKVLASAPAGIPNPYLGKSTKKTVAPAGAKDPLLGQVVIVSGPPEGYDGNDTPIGYRVEE